MKTRGICFPVIKLGIALGLLTLLMVTFGSRALATANLVVIDKNARWEMGVTLSGASNTIEETSLINLTERVGRSSWWEGLFRLGFRPSAAQSWTLIVRRSGLAEDIRTLHLVDPIGITHDKYVHDDWHSLGVGIEHKWTLPKKRSLQLSIGADLCTVGGTCQVSPRQLTLGYTDIIDPVVVGFSIGASEQGNGLDQTSRWVPSWMGVIEVVVSPSLALGTSLTAVWSGEGGLAAVSWGQKVAWRFSENVYITAGVSQSMLGHGTTLQLGFNTSFHRR